MNKIIIGTGWCVDKNRPERHTPSKQVYKADWLYKWNFHHRNDMPESGVCLYESKSDIETAQWFDRCHIKSGVDFRELPGRHDWVASFVMGLNYALFQKSNYIYIEQDCLVCGLKNIIAWSEKNVKSIAYGYGKYSFQPGWAEISLVYVDYEFLHEAIIRMIESDIMNTTQPIEPIFHNIFSDNLTAWPFGYGRKRPINFDDKMYYAQQMTDEEIEKMLNH